MSKKGMNENPVWLDGYRSGWDHACEILNLEAVGHTADSHGPQWFTKLLVAFKGYFGDVIMGTDTYPAEDYEEWRKTHIPTVYGSGRAWECTLEEVTPNKSTG